MTSIAAYPLFQGFSNILSSKNNVHIMFILNFTSLKIVFIYLYNFFREYTIFHIEKIYISRYKELKLLNN